MITITKTQPEVSEVRELDTTMPKHILQEIKEKVDERGFYLYKWISPEELRQSVQSDYLHIIEVTNYPLAITTFLFGFIGVIFGGVIGIFLGVMATLGIFYTVTSIILIFKALKKSHLYARGAEVVITDNHYISWGKILEKNNFDGTKEAFSVMETVFREPIFEESQLKKYISLQKWSVLEQLKKLATQCGKILNNIRDSKNSGWLVLVVLIGGLLYSIMMGITYFVGVWVVAIFARIFAWLAHRWLLIINNEEHTIQSLFQNITESAIRLKAEKKRSVSLLSEAWQNEWVNNLEGRLRDTFSHIQNEAALSTKSSIALRKQLEQSKYQEIFNFPKYDHWIKKQILEPIEELIYMLYEHKKRIHLGLDQIEEQTRKRPGDNFWGGSGTQAIEAQKLRFEMQIQSIDQIISMLEAYQKKLQ